MFNSDITQKIVGPPGGLRVSGRAGLDGAHTFHRKTSGDGTDISHYTLVESLDSFKAKLFVDIDTKADSDVKDGPGFEYPGSSGNFMSLGERGQLKWLALYSGRASLVYPVKVRTKDNKTRVSLADSAAIQAAIDASVVALRVILDAAEDAKENVQQASTIAAAQTAADAYLGS